MYTGNGINFQKVTSEHVQLLKDFTNYDETFQVLIEHNMSTTNDFDSFCETFIVKMLIMLQIYVSLNENLTTS